MITWASESSSCLGEVVGAAPQSATITSIVTALTASAPSMIPFCLLQRKRRNNSVYFTLRLPLRFCSDVELEPTSWLFPETVNFNVLVGG